MNKQRLRVQTLAQAGRVRAENGTRSQHSSWSLFFLVNYEEKQHRNAGQNRLATTKFKKLIRVFYEMGLRAADAGVALRKIEYLNQRELTGVPAVRAVDNMKSSS